MNSKCIQEIESAISEAMDKFLKKQIGEQAEAVSTQVVDNAIIVRFKGILPPAEKHMARSQEGLKLIKELKQKLIERAKPLLETMIESLVEIEVIDIHSSFDPGSGERIEIFTLNKNLEKQAKLSKQKKGE